ncbi:glucose/galactose MFS transporter [Hymenobacter amundsenii]|uniref:Glucose/galactose MFS transporter n=1 Tax=Hymenobacter amundsenii TaxID=2006685 RepID=A0A246FHP1_9BACT|nr:sugar MFS transporter [Hymenobacter amundsenii]OWP62049.1 glucose/galactose MFS transporter [Hymenobacter amundsenii]
MAAPISATPLRAAPTAPGAETPNYTPALASLTVLFFMMGFITCLNDILIPYLKAIFSLSYTQANLINLCFFGAYFVMGIPAGRLVQRIGYKGGMLTGFLIAALGAFLFYPAADSRSYGLFLGALFVLATGVVLLQVAGNPYVAILGPPQSAPARLTLTQAFNSLGTTVAPLLGSALILKNLPDLDTAASAAAIDVKAVQTPYLAIGVVLIIISGLLAMLKLPKIAHVESENEDLTRRAYHYRHLVFGVLGIFAYVGGEVAIGSHIVSYLHLPDVMSLTPKVAGDKVAWYWGGAMVGRFLGAYLLNKFNPGRLLAFNALGAVILVLISVSSTGEVAMWSLLAVGLMNSIMFATIFTLAVRDLGRNTEEASGLLNVGIVGGAIIPLLFGFIADASSLRWAFILPVLCYAYIMWYGLKGHRPVAATAAA